jgi:UDP-N-acetylmuramoyl-tripeptide--D-alanyl-D-alanine ligase
MTIVLALIAIASVAAAVSVGFRALHTLQLEGYRIERFWRHSIERLSPRSFVETAIAVATLAIGATLSVMRVPGAEYLIAAAAAAEAALLSWRIWTRPSKKPIVLTTRMYRIIAMTVVLCAVLAAASGWKVFVLWTIFAVGSPHVGAAALAATAYAIGAFLAIAMPFIGMAALTVLEPLEATLRRGFVTRAKRRLEAVSPIVIGVAGSYGKTTTKAALAAVLSAKYKVLATPESYNTLLGVTRTINEQLADDTEVLIVEMGARHPGDIAAICDLVQPAVGVITRLGPQHLEYFKTEDTIVRAKTELLRSLPADGIAIVDADGLSEFRAPHDWTARTIRVSARPEAASDALIGDIAVSGQGTSFSVTRADGSHVEATTKLLGRHAAFNSALAVVAGLELSIDPIAIRSGLTLLAPVEHRLQIVRNDSVIVIDDAFSSNPEGFAAALEVLGSFPGRRILITPGMIELGDATVDAHITVAQLAAETCDVIILVGLSWPEEFAQTLRDSGFPHDALHLTASLTEASALLATMIGPGDVVLFENDLPDNFA